MKNTVGSWELGVGNVIFLFLLLTPYFLLQTQCYADTGHSLVDKANKLYNQEKYDDALKLYNQAQIKLPDSAQLNYNIGTAQFKKGDYNSAISYFEKASSTKDNILEAKANYNIANSKYKLGKLKENTNLGQTVSLLRESLDYYKRAIELNPKDEDAKINHELVEKELKILLDKLKQQQEQKKQEEQKNKQQEGQDKKEQGQQKQEGQQGQDKEQQEKQEAQQQEKDKQGQENKAQEAKAQEHQAQEKQAQEAQEVRAREQAETGKPVDRQTSKPEKEMSKQEAVMLLDDYRQEEGALGKVEDKRKGYYSEVEKDW